MGSYLRTDQDEEVDPAGFPAVSAVSTQRARSKHRVEGEKNREQEDSAGATKSKEKV